MFHVFSVTWKINSALNCRHALGGQFKGFTTANTVRISCSTMSWCWNSRFDGSPQSLVLGTRPVLQSSCEQMGPWPRARHWRACPRDGRLHRTPAQVQDMWDLTVASAGVTAPQRGSQPGMYLSWDESVHLAEVGRDWWNVIRWQLCLLPRSTPNRMN